MNAKIDVLFEQIAELDAETRARAYVAVGLWRSAKTFEFLGLGPMVARYEYRAAYEALSELGLDVGGMLKPYPVSDKKADPQKEGHHDNGLHMRSLDYRTAATQHAEQAWQALDAHVADMVAQAVAKERARWAGVEQYLIAASGSSMSRNNSEALAAELLEQIRGKA